MKTMKLLLAVGALLSAANASALQVVEPVDGKNSFVKISAKETTRIYIDGGKVASLIGTDGELSVEKDAERGQLFIRPAVLNKPINVRIVATSGAVYNLVMQPVDIPQADIAIRDTQSARLGDTPIGAAQLGAGRKSASGGMTRAVRSLVSSMALDEPPNTVDVRATNQEFALWENTRFTLIAVYNERDLVGEKFVLTNTGRSQIRLVEQELYRKGVVAVAIENMQLEPGQSTNVYVVRVN